MTAPDLTTEPAVVPVPGPTSANATTTAAPGTPAAAAGSAAPHPHAQSGFQVRLDWGLDGALLLQDAHVVVVVDVLSFSTTVELAVSAGVEVLPWGGPDGAEELARAEGAALAAPRNSPDGRLSLAPSSVTAQAVAAVGNGRVVLPSPNGGAIARALGERGRTVIAGSLRNAAAVADEVLALQERLGDRATVAVIAAGERHASGALRPAVEDLLGAGAIVDALTAVGIDHCSPEAATASSAYHALRRGIGHLVSASASAEELRGADSTADVDLARQVNASRTVPVLRECVFGA
ncbi:2-phosphosulfolactate phosphatase [Planctomonas deserti]|uniref:2-phosphosulfolactate phosphatase n=1 Tax=Planctomonas deserti TaxID=2144185 RepID=UPI000D3754AF|nr:2-phosphosulfolactate phosphatase [Planctomonas deserti]